jgi:putative flippase GtrA
MHVGVAWLLLAAAGADSYLANFVGACTAFGVSFLGNVRVTFRNQSSLWIYARRYLCVSLFSFMITSSILAIVEHNGLSIHVYVLAVMVSVPPMSFLLTKFWAFNRPSKVDAASAFGA